MKKILLAFLSVLMVFGIMMPISAEEKVITEIYGSANGWKNNSNAGWVGFKLSKVVDLSVDGNDIQIGYEYIVNGEVKTSTISKDKSWSGYLVDPDQKHYSTGAENDEQYSDKVPANTLIQTNLTNVEGKDITDALGSGSIKVRTVVTVTVDGTTEVAKSNWVIYTNGGADCEPKGITLDAINQYTLDRSEPVAKIGDKLYMTLNDAVASITDDTQTTIALLRNVDDATGISVPSGRNIIFDFGGYTYTLSGPGAGSPGTETNGFQLLKDSTIVMKNGTINVKENPTKINLMIQNYSNLTLEDMTIDPKNKLSAGTANTEDYALSINNGIVHFKGNTTIKASKSNVISFDIYDGMSAYPSVSVIFDEDWTGTIEGTVLYDSESSDTHTLKVNGNGMITAIDTTDKEAAKDAITINSGKFGESFIEYLETTDDYKIIDGVVYVGTSIPQQEPSTPVCAGSKDKNCDGVITCDEEKGEGWTWNNELKVCEYTGKTSYTVVNTAAK